MTPATIKLANVAAKPAIHAAILPPIPPSIPLQGFNASARGLHTIGVLK